MKVQYLTEKQVSEITGRALQTLRNERHLGRGIPYVKVGRSIRYSLEDVVEFMESRKIRTQDSMRVRPASGRQSRVILKWTGTKNQQRFPNRVIIARRFIEDFPNLGFFRRIARKERENERGQKR